MKNTNPNIEGKKQFETEQGEFIIGQVAYSFSISNVEFSQEREMTTVNYSGSTNDDDKKTAANNL